MGSRHHKSAAAIYLTAVMLSLTAVTTGVVLLTYQKGDRELAASGSSEKLSDLKTSELCAQVALDWAVGRTGNPELNRELPWYMLPANKLGTASESWLPVDVSQSPPLDQCEVAIISAVRNDNETYWPPRYLANGVPGNVFEPVTLQAIARVGQTAAAREVQIAPNVHPALQYGLFATQYAIMTSGARIASSTRVRSNGYFYHIPGFGATPDPLTIFEAPAPGMLERPEDFNPEKHAEPLRFINPMEYVSEFDLEQLWNTDWFNHSPYPVSYPNSETLIAYLSSHAQPINQGFGLAPADCVAAEQGWTGLRYYFFDGMSPSSRVTVLTRVALGGDGIYYLDAQGGSVLLRSVYLKGTLFVDNLGTNDVPAIWRTHGLVCSLTIDKDCVLLPGANHQLPTLVTRGGNRDGSYSVLINLSESPMYEDQIDYPMPLGGDKLLHYPDSIDYYPPTMPRFTAPPTTAIRGVVLTADEAGEVILGADPLTTQRLTPFTGTLCAERIVVQRTRIAALSPSELIGTDGYGNFTSIYGLSDEGIRMIPYSLRTPPEDEYLPTAERQGPVSPLAP